MFLKFSSDRPPIVSARSSCKMSAAAKLQRFSFCAFRRLSNGGFQWFIRVIQVFAMATKYETLHQMSLSMEPFQPQMSGRGGP